MKKSKEKISIVIPFYNEAKNIPDLYREIKQTMSKKPYFYEIILVNDGSTDETQKIIEKIFKRDKKIKAIQFRTNFGKASALQAGFQLVSGEIIITLDGDLQDNPWEIPKFIKKIKEGYDLVCGWRQKREDTFIKIYSSKMFNFFTNLVSKTKLHDYNCGFKAYTKELVKDLVLYGELHRYIPVIASLQGYKVTEIPISNRKRRYGRSKYGSIRFIHGFLDLITVFFLTSYAANPLHFFGYLGLLIFSLGFIAGIYLTLVKFIAHQQIGNRPLLLLSVLLMIIGIQIGLTGLISEQISNIFYSKRFKIKKILK